jgi:hypothetical protein
LEIVKGPGEFPTGPSIAFASDSDIRILDGQAAITVRSYYAGETLIRASSPNLRPAEVALRFVGETPYKEGVTPAVQARPYVRFVREGQTSVFQAFGRNSPAFTTSARDGHAGASADDGDPITYWQPAENDANPTWTLDVERFITVSRLRLTFPQPAAHRFLVEVSDDRTEWRPLADYSGNDKATMTMDVAAPSGAGGRFVRLRFLRQSPSHAIQVSEVECFGMLRN